MLLLILLIIIWTIYIMKCGYERFHNIGKLDKMLRYDKDKKEEDIYIIE
jgi:hypothetical protein